MESHQHDFQLLGLKRITVIQRRTCCKGALEPHEYKGTAGDKAFITKQCTSCTKVSPVDYGPTAAMQTKLEALQAALSSKPAFHKLEYAKAPPAPSEYVYPASQPMELASVSGPKRDRFGEV